MTAILVAALFLGGAASAGIARNTTMTETINNAQTQTTINVATSDGLAPYIGEQPYTPGTQAGDMLGTPFYVCNAYSPYNIYTFTPSTPGSPVLLGNPGIGTYTMGATFDDDGVYWASSSTGSIYKISTSTGVATLVGATGLASVGGLSYDRTTGKLWGYSSAAYALYTINKATGAATLVWTLGSTYLYVDIAINSIGECYGIDIATDSLIKINLATGTQTVVGSFGSGYNLNYAQGAGFDRDTGILYSAAYVIAPATDCFLGTINTATGALTKLGSFPTSWEGDGLAIPYQTQAPHDILVKSIDAPVTGIAEATIIPKVTVYNNGFTTEKFNVSMKIWEVGVGEIQLWRESFETFVPMVNATFPPAGGWGYQNKNGGGRWIGNWSVTNSRTGVNNSVVYPDPTQNSDVLFTPSTYIANNNSTFSFYYKNVQGGVPETFKVGYWEAALPDWVFVDTITTTNGLTWTKYQYLLNNTFWHKNIYFCVNYTSYDWMGLRVDDFTLPDGTTQGFEGTPGYFTNASGINWNQQMVSGVSTYNYWKAAINATTIRTPDHPTNHKAKMAHYQIYPKLALGEVSRLYMTNPLNLSSYNQKVQYLNFWLYQSNQYSSYQDKVAVEISVDNGANWLALGEWRQYDALAPAGGAWYKKSVSLYGYDDQKAVLFAFKASAGNVAGGDITIDNVTITATPVTLLVNQIKPVTSLASGATTQVLFTAWAPPNWQQPLVSGYNNSNVKFNVEAKAIDIANDTKPSNNMLTTTPILYYPYFHDVAVTDIVQPSTGPGGVSMPVSYTIKNFGQFPENGGPWFFSNITICSQPGNISFKKDFSDATHVSDYWGPGGWTEKRVAGTSTANWTSETTGTSPTTTVKVGYRMAKYYSYLASSGSQDRLYSPLMNLSGYTDLKLKFWMTHDTGYPTLTDNIQWQYTLDNGATWTTFPYGTFYRSAALQGVAGTTTATWYEWKVDISSIWNQSSVRVGMLGTSYFGNNIYIDDVRLYWTANSTNKMREGFEVYQAGVWDIPADWTRLRTDNWQSWKILGTTPTTFQATCTEVGSQWAQNERLISPAFTAGAQAWVSFDRYVYDIGTLDTWLSVRYTINNGVTWVELPAANFTNTNVTGTYSKYIPALNNQVVKFMFRFGSKNDTSKSDYCWIDNLVVSDKAQFQEYMVPYVPPLPLASGASITVSPINWVPLPQPSGAHAYKAFATTFLQSDQNNATNSFTKTFTLTTGHDLSVEAITQPARILWLGPGAHPVAATIKNLGTYPETCLATATIRYTGNSTPVYTSTFAITALASGAQVTATFAAFTPTVSDDFTLRVEIPADENMANNFKELAFSTDVTPPTSSCSLNPSSPNGQNNWYVSDVTVTLTAVDPDSGVAVIKYKIDGAGGWTEYAGAFPISTDGSHTVTYYAIDNLGNAEGPHTTAAFKIDKTKPTITLTVTDQGQKKKWLLEATVSDVTSGVAKVEFYIAGVLKTTVTAAPWEYLYTGTDGPAKAIVFDAAGNSADSGDVASFTSVVSNLQQQTKLQPRTL